MTVSVLGEQWGKKLFDAISKMCESKTDIVAKLREGFDAVLMSKKWKPVVAQNDGINLTITQLIPLLKRSIRVRLAIDLISMATNTPVWDLQRSVQSCLEEIGHYRSMSTIRWVGLALCYLIKKNYSGILVNEKSIDNVKAIMGSNPVIFAPSHKSYADFILMSFLCFYYNIEIPVIAAGEDFQKMWLMGKIMRLLCAFFIRRSFGDDELYKAIIAEYLSLVAIHGHAALEFFIEGTRSRSGKSISPKFGLMTMALEPYFLGRVPDVTIVPVSITYERCLEDQLFARELLGVPKPKESTKLLVKALKVFKENYGRVFVEFGKPISVKKFCSKNMDKDPRIDINVCNNSCSKYPEPEVSECVKKLCFTIIKEHNKHLSFTAFHMLAASMSIWSGFENKVPLGRLTNDMIFLERLLSKLGYFTIMKESIEEEISDCVRLHHQIIYQDSFEGCLKVHLGMPSVSTVSHSKSGHKLSERTLSEVYPAVFLQEYANPVCLVTVHISILNFILCTTTIHELHLINRESLVADYLFWRNILSLEFVLQDEKSAYDEEFSTAVAHMAELNMFFSYCDETTVVIETSTDRRDQLHEAVLLGLIHPFLSAYALALDVCIKLASTYKEILEKELKYLIQQDLKDKIFGVVPKSILSLDVINNAIQTFLKLGALEKWKQDDLTMIHPVVKKCCVFHKEIEGRLGLLRNHLRACHEKLILQSSKAESKL